MFLIKLALRNVFRQYGRTSLSMVSIIFGVAIIIAGRGFVRGTKENIIHAQIDSMSGHVLVMPKSYPTSALQHPVDELIQVDAKTMAYLDKTAEAWTTRLFFAPRAVHGSDSLRIRAVAFDPEKDAKVFPRGQWMVTGKVPGSAKDGLLISSGVKRLLSLEVGGTLILETRTAAGAINALELPICGEVVTRNPAFDMLSVFMTNDLGQELVHPDGRFSHLAVRLPARNQAMQVAEELKRQLDGSVQVRTWEEESEGFTSAQDLRQRMLDIVALAIMAIAATGIANTILMAAFERIREIGTLRAYGMTRPGVVALFVWEGVIIGTLGAVLGGMLGGWTIWHFSITPIDLTAMMEARGQGSSYGAVPMSVLLYTEYSSDMILGAMFVGFMIAVLASIYPALLASRMPPAEAVRAI